ncbi:protein FAM187B isoform X1 [Mesocricetus auratus]|uniref:Protein FAM187B isoform X1 n=1 Tax=Mesocricetus auratus TaxID=10036 RepID=A0ABM2WKX2_MESAU|nr:protein FAM187B isoform X1 [Mesocricetus auratus]
MITILWALLSLALPVSGLRLPIRCPQARECQLALLSNNDVLLECNGSEVDWFFFGMNTDEEPFNASSISNIQQNPEGGLLIQNPSFLNTGLYRCRDRNGTQVTGYKIDFQDITNLYISHIDLDQEPLKNETLSLGHGEVVYTQWEPWQRCSNCASPGERKRLGFCYIKEPLEEPVPCGLYLGDTKTFFARVRPEMQVEACYEMCRGALTGGDYVIFDNFRFTEGSEPTWLTCPLASIYRPVHWEVNDTAITWQNQLSGEYVSSFMDPLSGGQQLKVFQPAIYRCFVEQELIAQFNPTDPEDELRESERQSKGQGWFRTQPGKADSVLRGLKLMLLTLSLLVVGGLLCKVVFRPVRGKKRNQVLLVK